jgi:GDP-4-dehydro-6-deoxy-D-mannose reductase
VIGASGFVGTGLLPSIRKRFPAARVLGTSRHASRDLVSLDVADQAAVRSCIGELRPTSCIHLAALSSIDDSFIDPATSFAVNFGGVLNVAQAILDLSSASTFILASSGDIYGLTFRHNEPLAEDALLSPANPYSVAKAAADLAVGEMALRGLRAVRLRLFNHTGAGQSTRFALPNFACQVAAIVAGRQEPAISTGNLERWRDIMDVEDVIEAYLAVLASETIFDGRIFNVCSGRPRHMRAVISEMIERAGIAVEVIEHPLIRGRHDVTYSAGRPDLFVSTLGWSPKKAWSATIDDLLNYWSERLSVRDKECS